MDLNNDGFNDILSGSYSWNNRERGMAGTFQVLYGGDDGFKKPVDLTGTDDDVLIIPAGDDNITEKICTRPTAVDWDGDGDLDLVVGNFSGTFYLFKGESNGGFAPEPEPILANDAPLRIPGAHSDPFLVDWDGDGDLDLLSGSSQGGVYLAENTADTKSAPVYAAFETLIEPNGYPQAGGADTPNAPAGSTRIWVDDINGDGKLDLLVGDTARIVTYPEGMTREQSQTLQAEWDKTTQTIIAELQAAQEDPQSEAYQEIMQRYQAHYQSRSEFILEESTGFVWLYLQQ